MQNEEAIKVKKKERIWEIDFLRGICLILMVFDHMMWQIHNFIGNFFNIESWSNPAIPSFLLNYHNFGNFYYLNDFRICFRLFILFLFFFLCGISINFSNNNLKRSLICIGFGLVITIITVIFCALKVITVQNSLISFGVLSCLGTCILITCFLRKFILKITNNNYNYWVVTVFILSFTLIFLGNYFRVKFPFYKININDPMNIFIGIIGNIFGFANFGGDFFPLVPYLGYMMIGCLFGETFYKERKSLFNKEPKCLKPITYVGRHSLPIYLFHIPVITIFHCILFISSGFWFNF